MSTSSSRARTYCGCASRFSPARSRRTLHRSGLARNWFHVPARRNAPLRRCDRRPSDRVADHPRGLSQSAAFAASRHVRQGQLGQGVQARGILVPQRAVSRDERGRPTVLVVGARNMAELRARSGRPDRRQQLARHRRSQAWRQGDRRRGSAGAARSAGQAAVRAAAADRRVALLHRPSDLRLGARHPGERVRAARRPNPARRAVPSAGPAPDQHQRGLSRRDATTLDKTTTQIIEQQLQGIDHLRYFSSQSASAGTVTVTLTFDQGTNPDTAQVQVQNKVQPALPLLPQEVQRQGVRVEKSSANFALVPGLYSADNSHSQEDLADMMVSKIQEPISRINGVGGLQMFGSQYAMRIWVDPIKLNSYQLTIADVTSPRSRRRTPRCRPASSAACPRRRSQQLNATVTAQSRLQTAEEFGAIRLKTSPDGSVVRLARRRPRRARRRELYGFSANTTAIPRRPPRSASPQGANALETIGEVKARIAEIARQFPPGVKVIYPCRHDAVRQDLDREVVETLFEAIAARLPGHVPVPAELARDADPDDRRAGRAARDLRRAEHRRLRINTLTMFGMVLAIGLLVDDAIVVVENVERLIQEERPVAAAKRRAIDGPDLRARWSASPWCWPRCSCRWPFSAARPA